MNKKYIINVSFFFLQVNKMKLLILLLAGLGLAFAQVPGFGGCPDFESQPDFDMNKVPIDFHRVLKTSSCLVVPNTFIAVFSS